MTALIITRNSSGDEIANVNFYDDIVVVQVLQNSKRDPTSFSKLNDR